MAYHGCRAGAIPQGGSGRGDKLRVLAQPGALHIPKTAYEKTVYLPFEHIRLPAPCGYDEVLTAEYGDYMVPVRGTADHDYPFYRHMEEDLKREIQRAGFKGTVEEFCEKVSAGELYV